MQDAREIARETMDSCLSEALKAPDYGSVNVSTIDVSQSLLVDSEILIHELQQVDTKNDQELYKLLSLSYKTLLDVEFINKAAHRLQIAKAFTNVRFVMALCNTVSSVNLTDIQKIGCNKLIYDYFTMSSGKDEKIINLLYTLGWNINSEYVVKLQNRGLDNHIVTYLVVARYSTTDAVLATKRVNVIIMNQPSNIMNEQLIVNIYEELFNDVLTSLFTGIMFDTWGDDIEMDYDQEEIYDTINLAILDIINEIPSGMIVQLLHSYAQSKQFLHSNERVRFDIHSISQDYSRILQAIEYTEKVDGIIVPHI